ncbi:hypothetical protein FHS42_005715 [Streptomyces zagrosensis]|uniref:Uncharacterized protein n=1 Tax=Streptomyces zagrosensis TaxID=1042984 RepID=A0A7W9V1U7_9ACTN|nr:hypothetical protein [Streptomyces zagrosensis]
MAPDATELLSGEPVAGSVIVGARIVAVVKEPRQLSEFSRSAHELAILFSELRHIGH